MVRTKKMFVDVKVHRSIIMCGFSLFHIDTSIHVFEHRENLMHQGFANLECINLVVQIDLIQ